ncbi:hypothetical protein [Flavobacterium sp. NKUCC04_CG]|uniref:hypothetical protein n=1 Tax=Flavobacterium sp. NKUCC04_CG TaxID=2842121 RepID=UPI00210754DA|nr:hypothetical protein [Flavobacterium sp. NKUCC04_CG]
MLNKIITFIVLLWFVYGIFNFDSAQPYSKTNIISYLGLAVFIVYLIYSLKKASRDQKRNPD